MAVARSAAAMAGMNFVMVSILLIVRLHPCGRGKCES
jgi:hypothetical protein